MDLNMIIKDASVYDELDKERYDVVLCDVPCTGLGVVSKKPDIKLHYTDGKRDSLVETTIGNKEIEKTSEE